MACAEAGRKAFDPNLGGDYTAWQQRPFKPMLLQVRRVAVIDNGSDCGSVTDTDIDTDTGTDNGTEKNDDTDNGTATDTDTTLALSLTLPMTRIMQLY